MLISGTRRMMGTTASIYIETGSEETGHETGSGPIDAASQAGAAIDASFVWLAEIAQQFTRFDATSELSQLNAAAGSWQVVSPLLYAVVTQSVAAASATDGLFDPALLPQLEALGYDRDFEGIAFRETGSAWRVSTEAGQLGRWREIAFDEEGQRIRLPAGVRLDLGGYVKGWAADWLVERTLADFANVLVSLGGDMRMRGGSEPGLGWPIGIGDVRADALGLEARHAAVVTLASGGLATSGATERWWYRGGERQHHVIDPRTGKSARLWLDASDSMTPGFPLIASATALAATATHAEIAAKCALLRSYPAALEAVERAWTHTASSTYGDDGVALIVLLGNGAVERSTNIEDYLATLGGQGAIWIM